MQQDVRMISVCIIMTIQSGCLQPPLASCALLHTSARSHASIIESLEKAIKSLARDLSLLRGSGENRRRSDDKPGCLSEQRAATLKLSDETGENTH